MTNRYFVIGNPIKHSLSPEIHAAFARQCGIDMSYEKRLFELGEFSSELRRLLSEDSVRGANVTVPFKVDAKQASTELTVRAIRAGAVNTLKFSKNKILGDNTDGVGFVTDVENRIGINLRAKKILLLGAGGAARGVLAGLMGCGCSDIAVANRTKSKAEALASDFSDIVKVKAISCDQTEEACWDVVINATSVSISGAQLPVSSEALKRAVLCYDLFYSQQPTTFMTFAKASGALCVSDGLGMLVEQAAESFYLWHGIRPQTKAVFELMRTR